MKKFLAFILFVALSVIFIPWLHPARAEQVDVYENNKLVKSVVFAIEMDEYFINNQKPGIKMDAKAFIENDRTYVPVRYLGYALGLAEKDINWDSGMQKATLKGMSVLEMTIGKKEIVTDGVAMSIDVAPLLKSEPAWRTYLPARYVAEGLGYEVAWDAATQTVICWPKGEPQPDVSAVQEYVKQVRAGEVKSVEPVEGFNVTANGYKIPIKTELEIDPCDKISYGVELDTGVMVLKPYSFQGTFEEYLDGQYKDLTSILTSKFNSQVVNEVMTYVRQKYERNQALPLKYWPVDGYTIEVASNAGNDGISVQVRRK